MGTNGSTMLEPLRQGLPPLDPAAVCSAASCALPARFEAVREARQFTRRTLDQWDIGERFDDVCLVVSELVTNALRHALPSDTPRDDQGPPVRLHLMRWTSRLVCAVRDPSHESGHAATRTTSPRSPAAGSSSSTPSPTAGAGTRWPEHSAARWSGRCSGCRRNRRRPLPLCMKNRGALRRRGSTRVTERCVTTTLGRSRSSRSLPLPYVPRSHPSSGDQMVELAVLDAQEHRLYLGTGVDERGPLGEPRVPHRDLAAGQPRELHAGTLRVAVLSSSARPRRRVRSRPCRCTRRQPCPCTRHPGRTRRGPQVAPRSCSG